MFLKDSMGRVARSIASRAFCVLEVDSWTCPSLLEHSYNAFFMEDMLTIKLDTGSLAKAFRIAKIAIVVLSLFKS